MILELMNTKIIQLGEDFTDQIPLIKENPLSNRFSSINLRLWLAKLCKGEDNHDNIHYSWGHLTLNPTSFKNII